MAQQTATHKGIVITYEILVDQRRRYTLCCLRQYTNPMALADLADEVTASEYETSITEVPAEEVKRVYMSLYHTHIPKLVEADVVQYNQDEDMVQLSEDGRQLEQYEKLLDESSSTFDN